MTHATDIAAVRAAEQALYRAMVARDFAALERLLAPDVVYVHSTAVAEDRVAYLAGVADGLYEYASVTSHDAQVRIHGDGAFTHGICAMRVGAKGEPPVRIHLLFLLAWVRDGGAWRLVHRHATRVPDAA